MAVNIGTLTAKVTADLSGLQKGLTRAKSMMKSAGGSMKKAMKGTVKAMTSLKGMVVGGAVALGVQRLSSSFIDAASTAENYRVRLNAVLGSTQKGGQLFKDMAEYAGRVPFQYNEIMGAATQLAGVMQGGIREINQWMPMIGDLAAVSGLSIQEATEQVVRMYSAGAASADLFRERGILAMLGFKAGVSYTAEETRAQLMKMWKDPASKFKDASIELGKTWSGLMSMFHDLWFNFRTMVMESGIFAYLKERAGVLYEYLKKLQKDGTLQKWADAISKNVIQALKSVEKWVTNAWQMYSTNSERFHQDIKMKFDSVIVMAKAVWTVIDKVAFAFNAMGTGLGIAAAKMVTWIEDHILVGVKQMRDGFINAWSEIEINLRFKIEKIKGYVQGLIAKVMDLINKAKDITMNLFTKQSPKQGFSEGMKKATRGVAGLNEQLGMIQRSAVLDLTNSAHEKLKNLYKVREQRLQNLRNIQANPTSMQGTFMRIAQNQLKAVDQQIKATAFQAEQMLRRHGMGVEGIGGGGGVNVENVNVSTTFGDERSMKQAGARLAMAMTSFGGMTGASRGVGAPDGQCGGGGGGRMMRARVSSG